MEILYTNCAGLDVHKKTVKVCLLTQLSSGQPHKEFRTYFTTTEELLKLSDWGSATERVTSRKVAGINSKKIISVSLLFYWIGKCSMA